MPQDASNTLQQNQNQPQTTVPATDNFNPMAEIDLSNIEIYDTSKGDKIDFGNVAYSEIFSFKCLNCDYKYEGKVKLDKCPRCGSDKIDDSQ
jgi:rubrerythrin